MKLLLNWLILFVADLEGFIVKEFFLCLQELPTKWGVGSRIMSWIENKAHIH